MPAQRNLHGKHLLVSYLPVSVSKRPGTIGASPKQIEQTVRERFVKTKINKQAEVGQNKSDKTNKT